MSTKKSAFNVHPETLKYVKALIMQEGVAYLHGDGNLYDNKVASDFRKDYSNPNNMAAKNRIIFKTVSQVPANVADLDPLFYEQTQREDAAEKEATTSTGVKVKTLNLEKTVVEKQQGTNLTQAQLDDLELQRQIAEEEQKKTNAAAGGAK